MSGKTTFLTDRLYDWYRANTIREADSLRALRERTDDIEYSMMQISPEQGQFMGLLMEITGARNTIEVGTYTGYSALAVALALPEDGKVIACDISETYTAVAREYWEKAGVAHKIDLVLGPAIASLEKLLADGRAGDFDFVFIDANKDDYDRYYELALKLLHPGGLVAIDNTLWGGDVANPENQKDSTQAIRALDRKIREDERVSMSLLPIGDGLLLARTRG
ncbi:MAG: class I SAM-dependent methyltransferase [Alphaproteobacteria bacterium]